MLGMREIFLVSGGLGLFLFGMKIMSGGLELIAGNRMQGILKMATSNRVLAVIVGIIATIAINSSTAVTIMTVSFVNTAMMTLAQAIGIILGANVGTTFSAQLIAFRIDTFAPFFIFVGVIMYIFFKNSKIKNTGYIVLGFGILFFGVSVMGQPLRALANEPAFNEFLTAFTNPFLALIAGFVFTAIIQSSSATMGILVTLHLSGVPLSFETSAFIILGTNIGTSITTVIASIPANRESKRAALFHIMYDIIGSAVFGTLIFVIPAILNWFTATWYEPARQVAMFHTLYNFATMFLLLPFVGPIAKLMTRLVPAKVDEGDAVYEKKFLYLESALNTSPSVTLMNAKSEILRMGRLANENHRLSVEAFFENDINKKEKIREYRKIIVFLRKAIKQKLIETNSMAVTRQEAKRIQKMVGILNDISKIDEQAKNILSCTKDMEEIKFDFSPTTLSELKRLSGIVDEVLNESLLAYEVEDARKLSMIKSQMKIVKSLKAACVESRAERLVDENYSTEKTAIFTTIIRSFERSAERAKDIAFSISPEKN
ncbi:MAG: Na/Pi cotransporter family protein [Defluviitaleaceae bacterium]|nr:Na/Pi cotransporter family protein [Defluviitaleaceae bacterium]MCL2239037.1 Na/Pi cotransporter family protein [Defluviitaleaceae bacterium]